MKPVNFDPFAGGELIRVSPTTWPQKEIIASAHMSDEANTAFNEAVSITIEGELNVKLLELCFNKLLERHDILRATFSRKGDEICLHELKAFEMDYEDLRQLDDEAQKREISNLWRNIAISPMNLQEGPLFFAWIKQLADIRFELIIAAHHVICDGWSIGLLLKELTFLYRNNGSDDGLPKPESFFDFAEQIDAQELANTDIDYWHDKFKKIPPVLDLPLDNVRPPERTFQATRYDFILNEKLAASLPKAAAKIKASLVNFVLAGYFILLHRLTSTEDLVVGLPVAGQAAFNRLNQIGHMVQLLPIRLFISDDTTFTEVVGLVKNEVLNANEHPNFTFSKLLEKLVVDRSRVPLVCTIFNIDQAMNSLDFGDIKGTLRTIPRAAENFEIFLNILPSFNCLTIEATYSTALFNEATIVAWLRSLETILSQGVSNPGMKISDFGLASSVPDIVMQTNATAVKIKNPDFISAFHDQVQKTPDAIAVLCTAASLTYRQLYELSENLAKQISENGIDEGDIVGICCQRSEKMLACILALFKIGVAYLPLDPDFPNERLLYMLEDSAAVAVIEDSSAPKGVRESAVIHLDIDELTHAQKSDHSISNFNKNPNRLAYLIYTSGSTGKPKGVRVHHRAMINFLESMAREPGCGVNDRLLAVTTLSFDISVLELYLPLICGATIIIASLEQTKDGEKLSELIEKYKITLLQATPATWRILLASKWRELKSGDIYFKALCGGEPLPSDLVADLLPRVKELWNMFGPTETTVWSTCKLIKNKGSFITVGKPIANTECYILDRNLNPLPISAPGELFIGGEGVALGYHNRPDLNAERFLAHPTFGRIYRTGDLAKILPNGELQHLGRLDDQVKLRGYRIELGEIETALVSCESIRAAAVYLWELSPSDVRIVACCVPLSSGNLQTNLMRKKIRQKLPSYMIPQYILEVDNIPLTPNGKVNRRSLPRPEVDTSNLLSTSAPVTENEKLIARIWKDLIKLDRQIGREDNFFEIGGHSLLALEFIRQLEKATGKRFTLREIIVNSLSSIANDAPAISTNSSEGEIGPTALSDAVVRGLSPEQHRLLMRQLEYPDSVCNNLRGAWVLEGSLDLDSFKKSIERVYERQTALRTIIQVHEGEYRQTLLHVRNLVLPDYEDYSEKADPLREALKNAYQLMTQPFAPIGKLLNRAKLYRLGSNKHLFIIVAHQLFFDGWSYDVFLGEIEKAYQSFKENRPFTTHQLLFEYRDYSQWCRTRKVDEETLTYHRQALDGITDIGIFRNTQRKGECNRREFFFPKAKLVEIEGFCASYDFRLHEFFLTIFIEALSEKLNQNRIVIGMPVSGRYNPDVIGLVGSFVSVLPFEVRIHNNGLINNVKSIAQQLNVFHEKQDISYAEIVKGTSRENELFPVELIAGFSFQDVRNRPTTLADLSITQIITPRKEIEMPLEFWTRIQADGFLAFFDYDPGIVPEETIEALGLKISNIIQNLEQLNQHSENSCTEILEKPAGKKTLWRKLFQ